MLNAGRRFPKLTALGLAIAALLLACQPASDEGAEVAFQVPVSLGRTERRDIQVTSEVVGTLAPWRHVTIAPEITGTIATLEVELGDTVNRGDTLFIIDPTDAHLLVEESEAALEGAQATLLEAEASHTRINRIAGSGVASEGDLDTSVRTLAVARAAERRARASLNMAHESLSDCTIIAPITGEVTRRLVEIGEMITVGTPSVEISDLNRVKFVAEVTESERVCLTQGQAVDITVDVLDGEIFEGRISALGSNANMQTLTFPIEIAIDNFDGRLLAGMIARARLVLEERPGVLTAPLSARVTQPGVEGVFTVVTGESGSREAQFVEIEFGPRHGNIIEIENGLSDGDEVVVRGADALRDGVLVRLNRGE